MFEMSSFSDNCGYDHLVKILVIGDISVGKTSLITRFTKGKFKLDPQPTTVNNIVARHVYIDGKVIKAQIVDVAGSHRYRPFNDDVHVKNAEGAVIVYDVTRESTLENVEKWYGELKTANGEIEIMLVGNKTDILKDSAGKAFAERKSFSYIETSAKADINVEKAFAELVTKICRNVIKATKLASQTIFSQGIEIMRTRRKLEPAHYMMKIESFSLLDEAKSIVIESDVFEARSHKWRLDLYPNGNKDEDDDGKYISLDLVICDTDKLPKGWEVFVDVNIYIYDHRSHSYATFQDLDGNRTRFHEKYIKRGIRKIISLVSFTDSNNAYLFNDECVFGVEVFEVPGFTTVKDRCLSMIKPHETVKIYTWTIHKFSSVTETVLYSEIFKVGKVKWKLSLYPKGLREAEGKSLSMYLKIHDDDANMLPHGWRVLAEFKLRVKNQLAGKSDRIVDFNHHWFCKSSESWGRICFMPLSELGDMANGFLLDDNLIVVAEIPTVGTLRNFL